jgi:hypothetical protein
MSDELDDAKREILSAVANGSLSPQEAAERLHALDHPEPEPAPAPPPSAGAGDRPTQIRVLASLRKVEVRGDRSVAEAVADGSHKAWRDGDTLVVESEVLDRFDDDDDDDELFYGRAFRFSAGGRPRVRIGCHETLVIRMNPDLALDARVEAGALSIRDVTGPIRARVSAGSASLDGFAAPLDVEVAAGGFKGRGRLDRGRSRVRCDAGSVKLHLDRGSSVAVRGEAHLGSVDLAGRRTTGMFNESTSVTLGSGSGTLDIECNLGSVKVTSDS